MRLSPRAFFRQQLLDARNYSRPWDARLAGCQVSEINVPENHLVSSQLMKDEPLTHIHWSLKHRILLFRVGAGSFTMTRYPSDRTLALVCGSAYLLVIRHSPEIPAPSGIFRMPQMTNVDGTLRRKPETTSRSVPPMLQFLYDFHAGGKTIGQFAYGDRILIKRAKSASDRETIELLGSGVQVTLLKGNFLHLRRHHKGTTQDTYYLPSEITESDFSRLQRACLWVQAYKDLGISHKIRQLRSAEGWRGPSFLELLPQFETEIQQKIMQYKILDQQRVAKQAEKLEQQHEAQAPVRLPWLLGVPLEASASETPEPQDPQETDEDLNGGDLCSLLPRLSENQAPAFEWPEDDENDDQESEE